MSIPRGDRPSLIKRLRVARIPYIAPGQRQLALINAKFTCKDDDQRHLIKMRLGASSEEVDETVTYLRAYCKEPRERIELHTIEERSVRLEAFVATLRLWGDRCGQTRGMTIRAKFTSTAQHPSGLTNLHH